MVRFLENIQKELLSAAHYAALDNKRLVPSVFSPTFPPPPPPPHHPYFSQLLFNNSYINRYPPPPPPPPPLIRFGNTPADRTFPFHLPTQKRRRTKVTLLFTCLVFFHVEILRFFFSLKVTDTRLSPRIATKIIPHEDLVDDDKSVSNHSYDSNASNHHHHHSQPSQAQSTIEYNAFQISILQMTFCRVRVNRV